MKRTTFDNMDYETYVAGEVKIIYSRLLKNDVEAMGRMRVLMLMAHWQCKCREKHPESKSTCPSKKDR